MSKASLLKIVKEQSSSNVSRWKRYAINHIMHMMSCSVKQAEEFYQIALKGTEPNIVLNIDVIDIPEFFCNGEFKQKDNEIRRQARQALKIHDTFPTWATFTKCMEGNRHFGNTSLILEDLKEYIVFQGDPSRLSDPSRVDFLTDPIEGLFAQEHQKECRAIATILAMGPSELSGMGTAISNLESKSIDFGRCTVLIFDQLSPENISKILVSSEDHVKGIRSLLDKISKAISVEVSNMGIRQKDPFSYREEDRVKIKPSAVQHYFCVGDRICTKRTIATAPLVSGTILDISDGMVTIQWDHKSRSIINWAEALMTLVPHPERQVLSEGDIIYTTPGMDSKTIKLLTAFSIDPVTLYSVSSHCLPSSSNAEGWKDALQKCMISLGLTGDFRKGYVETDAYFEPKEWFEIKLASGMRVIIDYSDSKLKIEAGEAEDYIVPKNFPVVLEE